MTDSGIIRCQGIFDGDCVFIKKIINKKADAVGFISHYNISDYMLKTYRMDYLKR